VNSQLSALVSRLTEFWGAVAGRFAATGTIALTPRQFLVAALLVASVLAGVLLLAVLLLPAQRKVVRKRRVRVVRREVSAGEPLSASEPAMEPDEPTSIESGAPRSLKGGAVWSLAWLMVAVVVVAGTYAATSTNWYCAQSCHGADVHVAVADEVRHAPCVECHESDPVSGSISRIRMVLSRDGAESAEDSIVVVDPARCTRCHRDAMEETRVSPRGVRVSHVEINAGGRTCAECHTSVGHSARRSFSGTMSQCLACHDGRTASRECATCHKDGSPLVARIAKKSESSFDYPAVRVANRDCARCHGAEKKCRDCHNGLVLPHSTEFVQGGHARTSAFSGKEKCFKCHPIMWCGDGRCHEAFSAHDERTWRQGHQSGTSAKCGSCHLAWNGKKSFCKTCH